MSNAFWAPGHRRAFTPARLQRLALLTLVACLVSMAWANHASAVVFSSKPFANNRPGTMMRDVVVRGSDNHVWLNTFNGTNWNGWLDLGGDVRGRPTSVSFGQNHLDVFARDSANHLVHRWWNGTSFSNWEAIGGAWQFVGDPIPVSWSNGRIDVFARGTDNALIHTATSGGGWMNWESLGGSLGYDPAVISHHAGHLDIFGITPGGLLNHRYFDSAAGGWSTWQGLGGFQYTSAPSAATSQSRIMAFARGTDGAASGVAWNATTGWAGPFSLGPYTPGQPSVVSYGDPVYDVFVRGGDNYLYHRWYDGSQWYPWSNVGGAWVMTTDPFAVAWKTSTGSYEDVFAIGNDGSLTHIWFNGSAWQAWENLGAPYPTSNQYGGSDHIVSTDNEIQNVLNALPEMASEPTDTWSNSAVWQGLSPQDQQTVVNKIADWSVVETGGSAAGFSLSKLGYVKQFNSSQTQDLLAALTNAQLLGGTCALGAQAVSGFFPNAAAIAVAKVVQLVCAAGILPITKWKNDITVALAASSHPGVRVTVGFKPPSLAHPFWRPYVKIGPWNG